MQCQASSLPEASRRTTPLEAAFHSIALLLCCHHGSQKTAVVSWHSVARGVFLYTLLRATSWLFWALVKQWLARHWWAGPRRRKEPMAFLPVSEYQPPHNDDDSTEDDTSPQICNICLMDLQPGDDVCIGPVCSHVFHDACIHEWLLYSTLACPNCRQSMW
jgi:hypothetical protein